MNPHENQPLSQPTSSRAIPSMDDTQPRSTGFGDVVTPAGGNTTPSSTPPSIGPTNTHPSPGSRGGKAGLILLLLIFMASTAGFGYLWWKSRGATPAASTSPIPVTIQDEVAEMTASHIFSMSGDASAAINFRLQAASAYRAQITTGGTGTQAFSFMSQSVPTYMTVDLADGYLGDDAEGRHVGRLYAIDITDSLKKDEPAGTAVPFGGQVKASDKQAAYTKLHELLERKETDAKLYAEAIVFSPFSDVAKSSTWFTTELLEVEQGFKGYTVVGIDSSYNPVSYLLLSGKLTDASGASRNILVVGRIQLDDEFMRTVSQGKTPTAQVEAQKQKATEVQQALKLPDDTQELQKKLVTLYKTLRISQ